MLSSARVTPEATLRCLSQRTGAAAAGRRVVAAQDTTEVNFPGRQSRGQAGSLAWMSWIVARLGGWNCYYKAPGPKTMSDGWQRFTELAEGFTLANTSHKANASHKDV